jgi:hypothetical protein
MYQEFGLLFARPSFLEGAARILDLFGVFDDYNYSLTPEQADLIAFAGDAAMLGRDLRRVQEKMMKDPTATKVAHGAG